MDVKFINPFLYGTAEVLEKMAFIKPIHGKPFVKTDDTALSDVSGIIGMTGDAVGSLALTFDEECIIYITNKILGENHKEINKEVLSTVGELTNVISGSARKTMEKENLKVFASIPTIVFGKAHTVRHIIKGPSIVIPFQTEKGTFFIDVCLKSQLKKKTEQPALKNISAPGTFNPKAINPAVFGRPQMPHTGPEITQEQISKDLGGRAENVGPKDIGERLVYLKQLLSETLATKNNLTKQLKEHPFMEYTQRQRYTKALPAYDAKIKRLKLDIAAAETINKMSKEELENPTIKPHYQHYATVKPGEKK